MKIDREIDLRGEVCPYTFVKSKLVIEEMELGQVLRIIVDYPPAVKNVPKSLEIQGDQVLEVTQLKENEWEILVKKAYEPS